MDERAAQEGCRFSEKSGQFAVDWVSSHCMIYEGSKAGLLMDIEDWQYECFMQIFGWKRKDEELNKWLRRFNTAHVWISKKNGKSPTAAAMGLYMLMGDGEAGQKCFSAAHDGEQAKIAHKHALAMVQMSPQLNYWCHVNNSTGCITYLPTRSEYSIVTGKNVKSTQGLNGSVFIDEVHVVDEAQYDSLQYAGVSRHEPILATFSTSGSDISSLGYNLYCKSQDISKGTLYDPKTYVMICGDTSAEKVATPEGRLRNIQQDDFYDEAVATPIILRSNPAAGRLVRNEELIASYRSSKRTRTEFARFMHYRANQWTSGEAGWIHPSDWAQCGKHFTLAQMHEEKWPCAVAVDLSRTGDMTSVTATFSVQREPEVYIPYQWTWSWIPERTANERARTKSLNYDQWVNDHSCLTVIKDAKTVPYSLVASRIGWICENFECRGIGYDAWNSAQLINMLVENYDVDPDAMYKIPQTMAVMGPLSSQFEKDVLDKTLVHNGNELLAWQIGNVQVHEDSSHNIKPHKPQRGSHRSIDGIISSIMSEGLFYLPDFELTNKPIGCISLLESGAKYVET